MASVVSQSGPLISEKAEGGRTHSTTNPRRTRRSGRTFQCVKQPLSFFFKFSFSPNGESNISQPSCFRALFFFSFGVKRLVQSFSLYASRTSFLRTHAVRAPRQFSKQRSSVCKEAQRHLRRSPAEDAKKERDGIQEEGRERPAPRPRHTNPPIFRFKTRPSRLRKP